MESTSKIVMLKENLDAPLVDEPSALVGAQERIDSNDKRQVCGQEFDPCWGGVSWKKTPACSGVPGTWEALLLSDDMEPMCKDGGLPPADNPGCTKLGSLCRARRALVDRRCHTSAWKKRVWSGDTIYLRGYSSMYLDVNSSIVRARWPDTGDWEAFLIEKDGNGEVRSGDHIYLKSHDGSYLSSQGKNLASLPRGNESQFLVQTDGDGPVLSGSVVTIKTQDGKFVDVEGDVVSVLSEKMGNQQTIVIEKEFNLTEATALNFGGACEQPGPSAQDILSGHSVYLRSSLNGNLLDVDDDAVQARWPDYGDFQKLFIEKEGGGAILSNDTVFLKSHQGTHMDSEGGAVRARWNAHGARQSLCLENKVGGPLRYGDEVVMKGQDGEVISVNETRVHAGGGSLEEQRFIVEKGKWKETIGFLHIPKNAGTSIEDVAWAHDIRWGRWLMFDMVHVDGGDYCSMHHVPPSLLPKDNQTRYLDVENFCVIRHPYGRAVSEYTYRLNMTGDEESRKDPRNAALYKHQPCTEEGLNYYLQNTLERVIGGAKYLEDCHFVPQSSYIFGKEHQWCSHILKLENFPTEFNSYMEEVGYPVRLPESSENRTNSHGDLCPILSVASLTAKTRSLLNTVYAVDFRRLGYLIAEEA